MFTRLAVILALALAGVASGVWLQEERLSSGVEPAGTCFNNAKAVASDNQGNIHVVWAGGPSAPYKVWYTRWDADSGEWSDEIDISPPEHDCRFPAMAVDDSGNVHAVWQADSVEVQYRRRDTSGMWDTREVVDSSYQAVRPSIATKSAGLVAVAWGRQPSLGMPARIGVRIRDHSGWRALENVSDTTTSSNGSASASVDSLGQVGVLWHCVSHDDHILFRLRRPPGDWTSVDTVSDGYNCRQPSLSVGADGVARAVWQRQPPAGGRRLFCRIGTPGFWGDTVRLPLVGSDPVSPSVAIDDWGRCHAVWCANATIAAQVFYSSSDTTGRDWTPPLQLTLSDTNRARTSINCGPGGNLQVVWTDYRRGLMNPDVYCRRYEVRHDVGVRRVVEPGSIVDTGDTVEPTVWIRNYGRVTESDVAVRFRIDSTSSVRYAPSLAAGDSCSLSFAPWVAESLGTHAWSCSTSVDSDEIRYNDEVAGTFFVQVKDLGLTQILCPDSVVEEDTLVPIVTLRNWGNVPANAAVWFRIQLRDSLVYEDSRSVTIPSGDTMMVAFNPWPVSAGDFTARCSVGCVDDMHPENDTLGRSFRVVLHDVGLASITAPSGTVDSGAVIPPACSVYNCGSAAESYRVRLRIGDYEDSAFVTNHAPGTGYHVTFADWVATTRGTHIVRCSTELARDRDSTNNVRSCSTFVRVCDIAVGEILYPAESISRGTAEPRVWVANRGNTAMSFWAWFWIAGDSVVYRDSRAVWLLAGDSTPARFPAWWATGGPYVGTCWLARDMHPENDTASRPFYVARVDASPIAIDSPPVLALERPVAPKVRVVNLGDLPADFRVRFTILRGADTAYDDSAQVGQLAQDSTAAVRFPQWHAVRGSYIMCARTMLYGDENWRNDTLVCGLTVDTLESRCWTELASVPARVRAGGSMVAADGAVLTLTGSKDCGWFRYDPTVGSWSSLRPMPVDSSGRRVKGGAALCWNGRDSAFALKGNSTREFWCYDLAADSWLPLPSLPEGTKAPRFGSGLAFLPGADTDRVFMVKGSRTRDFLVYWVQQQQWHARRPVPPDSGGRVPRHGTALAAAGGRVFCIKGGTNEFYEYFPDTDSWAVRETLPEVGWAGRARRFRRGAALTSDGERWVYAFKGGNCNEFWRYDILTRDWVQVDDVPLSNRGRRVGDGGALAWLGGKVYALKGSGTREFWCYDPAAHTGGRGPGRDGVAGFDVARVTPAEFAAYPNPCRGWVNVTLPEKAGILRVFDASGREVSRAAAFGHYARVEFAHPGVYFIRRESGSGAPALRVTSVR